MTESPNPISIIHEWMIEAEEKEINDPTAMALATSTKDGFPSVRMVLLKKADENGLRIQMQHFACIGNLCANKCVLKG